MSADSVLKHLYHEELYVLPGRTLIILDKPWEACTEEEATLLQKILGSVKLSLSKVQVISADKIEVTSLKSLTPERIIAFGPQVSSVQKRYEFTQVDGVPVIAADPLSQLNDVSKKNLWLALRQMFGL